MTPGLYQVNPDHWFDGTVNTWPFRLRVRCTCGWVSDPFWNADKAANALIVHQAENGVKLS